MACGQCLCLEIIVDAKVDIATLFAGLALLVRIEIQQVKRAGLQERKLQKMVNMLRLIAWTNLPEMIPCQHQL